MLIKSLLISKKKIHNKIPIWFMRQAGRYLPEYREIRNKQDDFIQLCMSPELAAEISLQPIYRFNFDGIILFSDILIIPYALGQSVRFEEKIGPILDPLKKYNDLPKTYENDWKIKLSPVLKTINILKRRKKENKTLEKPKEANLLIKKLIRISILYLDGQIKAGVDVIQLFESWSGLLEGDLYTKYIVEPNKKIVEEIKKRNKNVPIICFPRKSNWKTLEFIKKVPCDGLSVDLETDDQTIEYCKKKGITVQGNLDPVRLLLGGKQLKKEVKKIIEKFNKQKFIFNLSHGILPDTPIKNVEKTIKYVKEYENSN